MRLYKLGKVPWDESQLIYHALAHLGWEALSLVSPATPYVCIGFHQDAAQEVDLEYCRKRRIPVFRRDLGGGAVYLNGDQLFFQLILRKDNPLVPKNKEAFYKKFLEPVINVYNAIGIAAEYKPINDVVVNSRKISGTGAAEIGECVVFVGNLIRDFDYEMMSKVLRVPDEKFRDKVHKTLMDNLSTIRRELGPEAAAKWDQSVLNELMFKEFQRVVGPMEGCQKDEILQDKVNEIRARMLTEEWLYQKGKRVSGRDLKIMAGMQVVHKMHKAVGGLLRADFELVEGRFRGVCLSGDFFCFPEEAISRLESMLNGRPIDETAKLLELFYSSGDIQTPGIEVDDWLKVLEGQE